VIDRCGLVAEACTVICRDGLAVCWNRIRRYRRTRHDKLSGPYSSVERTQVLVASRSEIAAIAAGIFLAAETPGALVDDGCGCVVVIAEAIERWTARIDLERRTAEVPIFEQNQARLCSGDDDRLRRCCGARRNLTDRRNTVVQRGIQIPVRAGLQLHALALEIGLGARLPNALSNHHRRGRIVERGRRQILCLMVHRDAGPTEIAVLE